MVARPVLGSAPKHRDRGSAGRNGPRLGKKARPSRKRGGGAPPLRFTGPGGSGLERRACLLRSSARPTPRNRPLRPPGRSGPGPAARRDRSSAGCGHGGHPFRMHWNEPSAPGGVLGNRCLMATFGVAEEGSRGWAQRTATPQPAFRTDKSAMEKRSDSTPLKGAWGDEEASCCGYDAVNCTCSAR